MNIKWGWWSFGMLLVGVLFMMLIVMDSIRFTFQIITTISLLLSFLFGIFTIVKRQAESKISFILGVISLVLSIVLGIIFLILSMFFTVRVVNT